MHAAEPSDDDLDRLARSVALKRWLWTSGIIAGVSVLISTVVVLLVGTTHADLRAIPTDTGSNLEVNATSPAPQSFKVDGSGSVVIALPQPLNGRYILEYTTDIYRYILLKGFRADGVQDGPLWVSAISDIGQVGVHGSTIINVSNVVMVQAMDVNGPWHLTFTKLS